MKYFWSSRQRALEDKIRKGSVDQGNRGGATAGKNLDGFAALIASEVKKMALRGLEIHLFKQLVVLPGYFRPAKQWDVVIVFKGKLLAAIELKSLGGPEYVTFRRLLIKLMAHIQAEVSLASNGA